MIHFVGAGCGATDLITVRGAKLLEKADVVIYAGSLVSKEMLNYCKNDVIVYDSSKMTLDEVLEIMIPLAREDKNRVRLHTGDPALYRAIKEQMQALKA